MSLITQIFSEKFVNRAAIGNNLTLLTMYRFAFPFAVLLNRFGFSPDQITTLSLVSAFLALLTLVLHASAEWFCLFWGLTVLFDFCDGTVARMSSRIATRAFRYDHMSDILKMGLVVLGVAIRFDETILWGLCLTFLFVYLYSEIVSHDLTHTLALASVAVMNSSNEPHLSQEQQYAPRLRERIPLVRFVVNRMPFLYKILQQIHVALTTFNGHTLLVFLVLPIGGMVTYIAMIYLSLLALRSCVSDIRTLWQMRR